MAPCKGRFPRASRCKRSIRHAEQVPLPRRPRPPRAGRSHPLGRPRPCHGRPRHDDFRRHPERSPDPARCAVRQPDQGGRADQSGRQVDRLAGAGGRRAECLDGPGRRPRRRQAHDDGHRPPDPPVFLGARQPQPALHPGQGRGRELPALRRRCRDRRRNHADRFREHPRHAGGRFGRDSRQAAGRPQQPRSALSRRPHAGPQHRGAVAGDAERRLCRFRQRREPRPARRDAAQCGRRNGLFPRHRQQDRGRTLRHDGAGGFAHHLARRLHHGRQDALLVGQPRPQHRCAAGDGHGQRGDPRGCRGRARRYRRFHPRSGHRRGRGLFGQLPQDRMDRAGPGNRRQPRLPRCQSGGAIRHFLAHAGRYQVDRRQRSRHRPIRQLPLRPGGGHADAALRHPARAGRRAAAADAHAGAGEPRRVDLAQLPHSAARLRQRWRRPAGRSGADGAAGPWRAVGARRLWLQQLPPVARQSRLRGAQRELPRLNGLRQGLHQRLQPAMVQDHA